MAPKVVSQKDDADLEVGDAGRIYTAWSELFLTAVVVVVQAMIKRAGEENEEVDGDAPEDA
eukprot:53132-Eustigmatos_ZCMA.PRE.1